MTNVLLQELQETLAPQIQVVKELGAGGMGTVFLGRDPALKRLVAIKVLNPDLASDESARLRFAREAEAAAAVAHPNVVSIFQVGALPRSKASYFVMQFIDGRTLSEEFPQGKPVPMPQARRIIGEVATALAAAHAKGLVHRDIKPANIMIDSETGRTVVLDFGISAVLQQRKQSTESKLTAAGFSSGTPTEPKLTAAGTSIGTPTYMSPEQASADEVTDKSDVYSLGVVAFELLTGRPPFVAASSWALMAAHINETPPKVRDLAPNVDPELADLIDTCLTKDPTARPAAASIARYLLPGAQSILEWPPPGLEQLHGTGSRLVTALGITVGVFWLFFASVLLQPARSLACCWSQALGWSLWDNLAGAVSAIMPVMLEDKDVLPFWRVVVFGCVVSAPLFGVFVWRRAWQFADGVRRARRAGYPWRVALQVAWDRRADTVSLLNGVDAYALLPEATRRRLVRLRWWQETCLGAAVLAATVMPLAWITGIIAHGGPASGEALPGAETLLIAAPALGCLLAAAALARPEARVRRRARAQRRPVRRGTVTIRPELVDVWLRAADVPAARGRRALPRPLVAAAAVIVVVVLAIAAALAVGATLLAASYVDLQRDMLTYWNPASARSDWRELRDLLSAYGGGRAAGRGVVHDVAPLVPVAFLGARERRRPIWAVDTMLLRAYPPESVGGDEPTLVRSDLARAWRLLPGRLPDSLAAALARDTASPGLRLWEAFASSPPPPPLWYLRPGLGGVQDLDDISFWAFSAIDPRLAAPRNTAAAVLALAAGDKAGALARAHENLAVGWRFYRDVGQFAVVFGLEVLDWGIGDLEAIGRVTADRSVIAEAARLRAAHARVKPRVATVDGVQQWIWPGFVQGGSMLFADPANPVGFGDISDTSLAPSLRFNLLSQVLWGYCTSAREILFGIDTHRRELLAEAERRLVDISRSSDWVDLNRRYLDWVLADPWSAWRAKHISSPAGVLAVAGAIGLRGAAGRMSLCIWH